MSKLNYQKTQMTDSSTSPIKYRILFIGSNPSSSSQNLVAFCRSTKSGQILNKWVQAAGIENFTTENVSIYPTPHNKPLTAKDLKFALPSLNARLWQYKEAPLNWRFVSLGVTADKALTMLGIEHYVMPHPSGMNRQLNDPEFVAEKIKGLASYANPSQID